MKVGILGSSDAAKGLAQGFIANNHKVAFGTHDRTTVPVVVLTRLFEQSMVACLQTTEVIFARQGNALPGRVSTDKSTQMLSMTWK